MSVKDLTAYLRPDLELPWRDRTFTVHPPSKDVGLKLATINAVGVGAYISSMTACPTCGKPGTPVLTESQAALIESMKDVDVAALALGQDVFDEMVEAGVSGPDVDMMGVYAMYYWVLGEDTADQIMAAVHGSGQGGVGPKASTSGRRSGSASRTRTASTRTTASRRT